MGTHTEPLQTEFTVYVRIMPDGMEAELDLPAAATGKMIIDGLLSDPAFGITKNDPTTGQEYEYTLFSKGMGKEVAKHKSLHEVGVKNGDTLILSPELVAG